jgi:hypothetical protein
MDLAREVKEITPSDKAALTHQVDAFMVGTDGDVSITDFQGNKVTLRGLKRGTVYMISCRYIRKTGTTAKNIVGMRYRV